MDDKRCEEQGVYCGGGDREVSGIPWQHPVDVHRNRERPSATTVGIPDIASNPKVRSYSSIDVSAPWCR